ncbi:hydrogenase expression/formation protein [Piscinibacter sakaiensis]|uniref:Hydrogenase maturation factor HoxQ n=1 Tax=Piscinibacter sakaiensis TaxID=1547922 RepID=A0A0K8P856_PISS1|nr:hydrogenase expression/formation protein [Piscinibacter sakaiensis]GAP38821.1 hydrogenase maturation factor HoxQ [Piscinibacter sakaiensis]
MKDFPIPVVALGPGSQPDDDGLDVLAMPQGMATFRGPSLPEPEEVAGRAGAHRVLREALQALEVVRHVGGSREVGLQGLAPDELALVNQVLGEGEVSARISDRLEDDAVAAEGREWRIQESVFAGVWRVLGFEDGRPVSDHLEIGRIPVALLAAARADVAGRALPPAPEPLPPGVMNAPMLLTEIEDQWCRWQPGAPAHVVNLTLLPMAAPDIAFLDHQLGTGRVLVLSRGYGNCRITDTRRPHTWRVVYYNSQDTVILNTVEVIDVPEVACAAVVDLHDSHERLLEVLQWVEGGAR